MLIIWFASVFFFFFFFNDTATTEIYTLSLHDALPIYIWNSSSFDSDKLNFHDEIHYDRSEEHTSELQSPCNLVCRLLLEKKKKKYSQERRKIWLRGLLCGVRLITLA